MRKATPAPKMASIDPELSLHKFSKKFKIMKKKKFNKKKSRRRPRLGLSSYRKMFNNYGFFKTQFPLGV